MQRAGGLEVLNVGKTVNFRPSEASDSINNNADINLCTLIACIPTMISSALGKFVYNVTRYLQK